MSDANIIRLCYHDAKTFVENGKKKKEAVCNYCNNTLKAVGTTTSNFRRHIEALHPDE